VPLPSGDRNRGSPGSPPPSSDRNTRSSHSFLPFSDRNTGRPHSPPPSSDRNTGRPHSLLPSSDRNTGGPHSLLPFSDRNTRRSHSFLPSSDRNTGGPHSLLPFSDRNTGGCDFPRRLASPKRSAARERFRCGSISPDAYRPSASARFTMRGVRKMTSSPRASLACRRWKRTPRIGMSPKKGTWLRVRPVLRV
jgi:hypothetical protein